MEGRERLALVTGGSGGIGAACARRLAADGFRVLLTYNQHREAAEVVADEIEGVALSLDLRVREAPAELAREIERDHGTVQLLVHNSGVIRDALLPFLQEADWQEVLDVSLNGPYRLTKALIKGMLSSRWGRVISIASMSGISGQIGQTHYSAAKAGLIAFTKSLALEVARYGVTANAIAPGFIDTPMLDALPEKKAEEYRAAIPLRRFGEPSEVADLVGFLASDGAAYITGQTFRISGGLVTA